jgi:hypothetical protein
MMRRSRSPSDLRCARCRESIERAFEIARNAVLFEVSDRGTPSRKLGSVGENAEGIKNQEHLIPVLKKRNNFIPELDTPYKRLQKSLEARSCNKPI